MYALSKTQFFYAKFLVTSIFVCSLLIGHYGVAQVHIAQFPGYKGAACVIQTALTEANNKVKEATGHNDGERVFEYLRAGGMRHPEKVYWKNRAWCGGFVSFVLKQCGYYLSKIIKNPLATAEWVLAGAIRRGIPEAGDLVLFNFSGRKIGADHIEICFSYNPNPRFPFFASISGNTADPDFKSGDGVYFKPSRLKRQISFVYPLKKLLK